MQKTTYKVGQIIYVLTSKETKIYPVQVVEEIIKRSITGESVSYIVKAGKGNKLVPISDIQGELFEDVESLREVLTKRIINTINNIVNESIEKASEWYEQPEVHSPIIESPPFEPDDKQDSIVVKLSDGKIANVKLPNIS
jgi:hypothetical protein